MVEVQESRRGETTLREKSQDIIKKKLKEKEHENFPTTEKQKGYERYCTESLTRNYRRRYVKSWPTLKQSSRGLSVQEEQARCRIKASSEDQTRLELVADLGVPLPRQPIIARRLLKCSPSSSASLE